MSDKKLSINADLYENWTDVSGFLMADPRIVENPMQIKEITYRELRELSYMGASVLHEEAVFPVRNAGIPINIKNTNDPEDSGTLIVSSRENSSNRTLTGIAGRKNFTVISIEKAMMNTELGFCRKVLSVLEQNNVSFENMPSGIDSVCVVISDSELKNKLEILVDEIKRSCNPDSVVVHPNMALIATVGAGMANKKGVAVKVFDALSQADINVRMIDQGSSEINILIGIENEDFEGIGNNDLIDYLKLISAYRSVLNELKKRFNLLSAIRYMIENPDIISKDFKELFEIIKTELETQNYNILNSYVNEDEIRIYVQTPNGLEELIINDTLFVNPLYVEAVHIYSKMRERDIDLNGDPLEVLENIEKNAKKGAYIQRYKGLGEMNPDQLWETTMNPENRRLLKIDVKDMQSASDIFELFMGDEVEPRREYIQAHAKDVKHLDV